MTYGMFTNAFHSIAMPICTTEQDENEAFINLLHNDV